MSILSLDIETFSNVNLEKCGVYRYVEDPGFKILLLAYTFDNQKVKIVDLEKGEQIPAKVCDAIFNPAITKSAFNAAFERVCLGVHFGIPLDPKNWHCSMVHAWSLGHVGGLGQITKALGFPEDEQKLFTGKNLIRLFGIPRKRTKTNENQLDLFKNRTAEDRYRYLPEDKPEEWEQFKAYCMRDVEAERALYNRLLEYPMGEAEQRLYELDQRINDRGVRIDTEFLEPVLILDDIHTEELKQEFRDLTGLENPNSLVAFKAWLTEKLGYEVTSVTKDTLQDLMEAAEGYGEVQRALEYRQELSKTSLAKYAKMDDILLSDNRVRGLLQFNGSSTGRWAGRLVQVQNLRKNSLENSDLDTARQLVLTKDLEMLKLIYGDVSDILSQLIRTAFIPSEGHKFIVSDFSAIEARIIAWYAGEHWRLEVFRDHGKIYEASAAEMFGIPIEKITRGNPEYAYRQKGKIAELACGYGGSVGALEAMGALSMGLTPEELPEIVERWRSTNPYITRFWKDTDTAAKKAITDHTTVVSPQNIQFRYEPGYLFIRLANGRELGYPNPAVEPHHEFQSMKITYDGRRSDGSFGRVNTYGAKLVENIVQATARDCLAEAMLKLDSIGYKIAFHVHDEVILDVPEGFCDLDQVNDILSADIPWAPELPMGADGFICDYYHKDA